MAKGLFRSNRTDSMVRVLRTTAHQEYDQNKWKKECGCYDSPPVELRFKRLTTKPIPPFKRKRS